MKRNIPLLFILLVFFVLLFATGCPSTPETPEEEPKEEVAEQEPEEEPEEEPEQEPEQEPEEKPEPLSDEEMRAAMEEIEKAKKASADIYASDEYEKAVSAYAAAKDKRESDPEEARKHLESAKEFAKTAFQLAAEAQYEDYLRRYASLENKLKTIEAGKFEPEKTAKLLEAGEKVKDLFKQEKFLEARDQGRKALEDLTEFYEELDEQIRWAKILKRDTELYMDDSEEVEAYIWAPEELQQATMEYTEGLEAYRRYKLEKSTEHFSKAKALAMKAVRESPKRKAQYQSQALMEETAKEIEEASTMTVVTEEGKVIKPKEWKAEEAEKEAKDEAEEEEGDNSTSSLPPPGTTAVLADESVDTLLNRAQELWKKGVKEREKGNYTKAMEYFEEAGRLANQYKNLAGGEVYVVEGGKTPPETLWLLSDMEYGSPFYWPLIWVENSDLINDPDSIFPGWEIYLPIWEKSTK